MNGPADSQQIRQNQNGIIDIAGAIHRLDA